MSVKEYIITVDNKNYIFELENDVLEFCLDKENVEVGKNTTPNKEENDIVLPSIIVVTRKNGVPLFALESDKNDINQFQILTAQQLYDKAIQWFEPLADNYHKLIWKNDKTLELNSDVFDAYKHYTWNQIINFSLVNRWSIDFRKGGGGDWKKVEADGYLIVTVNGTPYWADAIGQIPFAIDTMRDYIIKYNGDYTKAIKETINTGMEYGNGSIFFKEVDKSNTYDNYLVLRGCLWSKAKFKYAITKQTNGSEKKQLIMINSNFEEILDSNIKVTERDKYAQWNY